MKKMFPALVLATFLLYGTAYADFDFDEDLTWNTDTQIFTLENVSSTKGRIYFSYASECHDITNQLPADVIGAFYPHTVASGSMVLTAITCGPNGKDEITLFLEAFSDETHTTTVHYLDLRVGDHEAITNDLKPVPDANLVIVARNDTIPMWGNYGDGDFFVITNSNGSLDFALRDPDNSFNFNDMRFDDSFVEVMQNSQSRGGAQIRGFGKNDELPLTVTGASNDTDPADTTPMLRLRGVKRSGGNEANIGDDETLLVITNNATDRFKIFGNGNAEFVGELKIGDLITGSNSGTALEVDANGKLCLTGQCA